MEKTTDFSANIAQKYGYSEYSQHFRALYGISGAFGMALLGLSACFSAAFFGQYLDFFGPETSIYAGFFLSCLIAYGIGFFADKAMVYHYHEGMAEPLVTTFAVLLIALNIYADYQGAPELGRRSMGAPPADEKTEGIRATYLPQISGIDAEIEGIEAREFYWCGVHNKAHKCESANFYIHPQNDRVHVAKIAELKDQKSALLASMDSQLSSAGAMHASEYSTYSERLKRRENGLRLGTIVCTTLYLILAFWRLKYGIRHLSANPPQTAQTATVGAQTATVPTPATPETPAVQSPPTPTVSEQKEAEEAWEKLVRENADLREELAAGKEAK